MNNIRVSMSGMTYKASNTSTAPGINKKKNISASGMTYKASNSSTAPTVKKGNSSISGLTYKASNSSTAPTVKNENSSISGITYKASNTSTTPTDEKKNISKSRMAYNASNTSTDPTDNKSNHISMSGKTSKASRPSTVPTDDNKENISISGMTYRASNTSPAPNSNKKKYISMSGIVCNPSNTSTDPMDNKINNISMSGKTSKASRPSTVPTDDKNKNISMSGMTSNNSTAPPVNKKNSSISGMTYKASNTSTAPTGNKKKNISTSGMTYKSSNSSTAPTEKKENISISGMAYRGSNTSTVPTDNKKKNIFISGIIKKASNTSTATTDNKKKNMFMSEITHKTSNTSITAPTDNRENISISGVTYKASTTSIAPTDNEKKNMFMSRMTQKVSNTAPTDNKDNISMSGMSYKPSHTSTAPTNNKKKHISSSFIHMKSHRPPKPDIINKPSVLISKRPTKENNSIKTIVRRNGAESSSQQTEVSSCVSLKAITGDLICIAEQSHLTAQEPWPKDVKLYQPYEVEQILLPDNANCLAVQAFLRMCNLDFEVVSRANAEFMSPSGKVPFIKCGAFVVSELEGIVQFVNNKGISLTANMESEQKSDMRAYMSLVHNVLENAELYLCWCDKETYNEVTKPRNGSVYPWPLNHFQTWSKRAAVCKRLKMLGWYNKTLEDVYQEVENCCQALTDRLEGKEFFFGRKFTEMDALVYGHVYSILTAPPSAKSNKLAAMIIHKYDRLISHCKIIQKQVMKRDCDPITSVCSRLTIPPQEPDMSDVGQNFISDTEMDPKLPETGDAEAIVTAESGPDTDLDV